MTTIFIAPVLVSLATFLGIWMWGGAEALLLVLALSALEVSLSFDNAIVNARVLSRMNATWQERFLTWGMPLAVFGIRFILPIVIVAAAALVSPWSVVVLAFANPAEYARLLSVASPVIHAFGGSFLLMVALKYFFDEEKTIHWLRAVEVRLSRWGRLRWVQLGIGSGVVVAVAALVQEHTATLVAGIVGIALFVLIENFTHRLTKGIKGSSAALGGAALFVYLNILDAAFSLDGVVGAFALTTQILIILAGLGIGAYFVRTFTVYLTRRNTIQTLIYLEHGAHWAIFFLAACLFAALFVHVPEALPGGVGLLLAVLSFLSSRKALHRK